MPRRTNPSPRLPRTAVVWPFFLQKVRTHPDYEGIQSNAELKDLLRRHFSRSGTRPTPYRSPVGKRELFRSCEKYWRHTDSPQSRVVLKKSRIPGAGLGLFLKVAVKKGEVVMCASCRVFGEVLRSGLDCACPVSYAHRLSVYQRRALEKGEGRVGQEIECGAEKGQEVVAEADGKGDDSRGDRDVTGRPTPLEGRSRTANESVTSCEVAEPNNAQTRVREHILGNFLITRTQSKATALMSGPVAMINHVCEPFDNVMLIETGVRPRVWVVEAGEDLEAGEELFWNYGSEYWDCSECSNPICCGAE